MYVSSLRNLGLLFDLLAYLQFTGYVFDVDWQQPSPAWIAPVAFAAFAFWATERFASLAGRTLRSWKRDGTATPEQDWPPRRMIRIGLAIGTFLVTFPPAMLMYQRVQHEGQDAQSGSAAMLLALALALFALLAPLVVIYAEFTGGSILTDDLNQLNGPLARAQAEQTRLRKQADDLRRRADRVGRTAERSYHRVLGRARRPVAGADQVVLVARALANDLPEESRPRGAHPTPVGLLTEGIPVLAYSLDALIRHMRVPQFPDPAPVAGSENDLPADTAPPLSLLNRQESGDSQPTRSLVAAHVPVEQAPSNEDKGSKSAGE